MNYVLEGDQLILRIPVAHLLAYAKVEKVKSSLSFTARQKQIIALLCDSLSYKEVGSMLGIAERTVKFHVGEIMKLVGLHTKKDLVRYFQEQSN